MSQNDRKEFLADLKAVQRVLNRKKTLHALESFAGKWRKIYGNAVNSWQNGNKPKIVGEKDRNGV